MYITDKEARAILPKIDYLHLEGLLKENKIFLDGFNLTRKKKFLNEKQKEIKYKQMVLKLSNDRRLGEYIEKYISSLSKLDFFETNWVKNQTISIQDINKQCEKFNNKNDIFVLFEILESRNIEAKKLMMNKLEISFEDELRVKENLKDENNEFDNKIENDNQQVKSLREIIKEYEKKEKDWRIKNDNFLKTIDFSKKEIQKNKKDIEELRTRIDKKNEIINTLNNQHRENIEQFEGKLKHLEEEYYLKKSSFERIKNQIINVVDNKDCIFNISFWGSYETKNYVKNKIGEKYISLDINPNNYLIWIYKEDYTDREFKSIISEVKDSSKEIRIINTFEELEKRISKLEEIKWKMEKIELTILDLLVK